MKKNIRDLLELQATDIRIRNLETKYKTIPIERGKLVAEFEEVCKVLDAAKKDTKKTVQVLHDCELSVASENEKLKGLLIKSAMVKKAAEYEAVNNEIAQCKERISDLETRQIELMDEVEAKNAAEAKALRSWRARGKLIQTEVRELDKLKEEILAEVKEKASLSKVQERNVSQSLLPVYKRLLASGKGEPLGKIKDGSCSNCFIALPPMTLNEASKGSIVTCDSCSCLLYDPEAKDV